jgi:AbiV family abortive infection protein
MDPYPKLTIPEIAEGIRLCIENAGELIEDANCLYEADRYPRALFCLCAADQEMGKVNTLSSMVTIGSKQQSQWKQKWKRFTDHKTKTSKAFINALTAQYSIAPDKVLQFLAKHFTQESEFEENVRRSSLYVDYNSTEKTWITPCGFTAETVEQWSHNTTIGYNKLKLALDSGMMNTRALEIRREVYADQIEENTEFEMAAMQGSKNDLIISLTKKYYICLIEEGILDIDAGIEVFGMTLREFIERP